MLTDFVGALRVFKRSMASSLVTGASVALAIAATSSVRSISTALYARDLGITQPAGLVTIGVLSAGDVDPQPMSLSQVAALRRLLGQDSVAGVVGWRDQRARAVIAPNGGAFAAAVAEAVGDFSILGIEVGLGRSFTVEEISNWSATNSPHVAVVGYRFWRTRLSNDPHIVGQRIQVDGLAMTVIGVTAPTFTGLSVELQPDVIVPLGFDVAGPSAPERRGLVVVSRLRSGVTARDLSNRISVLWPSLVEQTARSTQGREQPTRPIVSPARTGITTDSVGLRKYLRSPLLGLQILSVFALAAACLNLALLSASRGLAREDEIALRAALGARGWVMIRPLFAEALIMSALGALGGLAASYPLSAYLLSRLVGEQPYTAPILSIGPDRETLWLGAIACLVLGVVAGIVPSLRLVGSRQPRLLTTTSRVVSQRNTKLQRLLVSLQAAVAIAVSAVALSFGLATRQLTEPSSALPLNSVFESWLFPARSSPLASGAEDYLRRLNDRLSAVPNIESVSFTLPGAFNEAGQVTLAHSATGTNQVVQAAYIGPGFLRTLGLAPMAGREFSYDDTSTSPSVVLVSSTLANTLLNDSSPVGRTLEIADLPIPLRPPIQIIGVVPDVPFWSPLERPRPAIYLALSQTPITDPLVLFRVSKAGALSLTDVNAAIESLGRNFSIRTEPVAVTRSRALRVPYLAATITTFLACLNLLLALAAVYSLVSYLFQLKRHDMAVRIALGATRANLFGVLLKDTARLMVVAGVVSLPLTYAAVQVTRTIVVPGTTTMITLAYLGAAGTVMAAALLASLEPALRSLRVNPALDLAR